MIQGGEQMRFARQLQEPVGVGGEGIRQELQRESDSRVKAC